MCGIAGFIARTRQLPAHDLTATAAAMAETLRHRGPDDGGTWTAPEAGVALAARRLAIRDLSPAGHQPMVSADGRFVLVYNGEIYDTDALRDELARQGNRFRGTSDTEVLLCACAAWGPQSAVERLNGMFAFALWDGAERVLTLARDRMGIKPLYWAEADGLFLFGSELKALAAHPGWQPEVDRNALAAYARLSYVPAPLTIWRGAHKLEPGCLLTLGEGAAPAVTRYWDLAGLAAGQARDVTDAEDAAQRLEALLRQAVRRRLVSDVPLGVFLSGGIDSAAVAALAQAQTGEPVRTFTVGFAETGYDEAADAARVAAHLGCRHAAVTLTADEARACIPDLPHAFDEPFADSSQIPTLLISRFAKTSVTVALTGDGGDEVFGGYNRHAFAERHWPRLQRWPAAARRALAGAIAALPPTLWENVAGGLMREAGDKAHKLAAVMALDDIDDAYRLLAGQGVDAGRLVIGGAEPPAAARLRVPPALSDAVERVQLMDTLGYLPDDILTKVDRASMSVSLEARVPLLDHEVVAFAWRLPRRLKVADGLGKRVLRSVLGRHLPPALFAGRPKAGFAVPLGAWLRGPLREWAESLLSPQALAGDGYFDAARVGALWREHLSGRVNRQHALWNVLMFQAWLDAQKARAVPAQPPA